MMRIAFASAVNRYRAKSFVANINGVAGIEAAFIFPAMLLLYFGLLDLTTVLSANRRVTQMASTLADLVTQSTSTTSKAELQGFYRASTAIMDPYSTTDLSSKCSATGAMATIAWSSPGRTTMARPAARRRRPTPASCSS